MEFEWDIEKSVYNALKHGVTFEEATQIWEDKYIDFPDHAYSKDGEARNTTFGWIDFKLYVAIWTKRNDKIRIISVRRMRNNEEETFFESFRNN